MLQPMLLKKYFTTLTKSNSDFNQVRDAELVEFLITKWCRRQDQREESENHQTVENIY